MKRLGLGLIRVRVRVRVTNGYGGLCLVRVRTRSFLGGSPEAGAREVVGGSLRVGGASNDPGGRIELPEVRVRSDRKRKA